MKLLKKFSYVILIILLLSSQVVIPDFVEEASAQSLKDYRTTLEELKQKYEESQDKKELTEEEVAQARDEVAKIAIEKEKLEEEIEKLEAEIVQLEKQISEKNKDMEDIIRYYQLSSTGEDAYLEYLFTSTDFTDFIYRMAIAEQLSDYNNSLIDDYTNLIKENEEKKEEVSKKIMQLEKKNKELEDKIIELSAELSTTIEGAETIEDEIARVEKKIKEYEKMYEFYKCEETMDYEACEAKGGESNLLPPGTAFYRPVVSGRVSSNWGSRSFILNGRPYSDFHYGIDLATSHGNNVYSAANGKVVEVINAKSQYNKTGKNVCGGNKIYIEHNINGVRYVTGYFHLATIKVKVGQVVSYETVIGTVGGTSAEYWDNCSTGAHVHFQVATGQFITYSNFTSNSFNPRKVLNVPSLGKSFSNRQTKY